MNEKTAGLAKARAERSLKKRRAVEDALSELKARNETITFKAVATLAGVGRPYLYNNFREIIEAEREATRSGAATIDGVTVPHRTADESRHIEALLRKKVDKLKEELGDVRRENARLKTALEKERGLSEHYRQNWIKARSE
ncbi:MAG TPA: DUF6262 family protein [Gammaproteobacteria bacterium]|nr:DUF6262 family protein [Gammaproteobacteria bacterium]